MKNAFQKLVTGEKEKLVTVETKLPVSTISLVQFIHAAGPSGYHNLSATERFIITSDVTGIIINDTLKTDSWRVPFANVIWYRNV